MPRYTIANMHQWAKKRGGKCLSEKYVNNHTQLGWQCAKGHKWKATPYCIKKSKGWCSECNKIIKREKKLNLLHKIAEKHEGKCLSKAYVDTAMEWKCKNGHKWRAKPITIINGIWCPKCKKKNEKIPWLNQMQKIAKQHGGKCLSKEYIHNESPLIWQCKNGHKWEATPRIVSNFGIWCTKCNKINKTANALKRMQKIAKEHGGKCLSKKYINSHTHLKWQCKDGHIWSTAPRNIIQGNWCPKCYDNRRRKNSRPTNK